MKFTLILMGIGLLLIVAALVLFVRRSGLAEEAYTLEREREQLALEQKPEDRERYLRVQEERSRLNSQVGTTTMASIACGGLGAGVVLIGLIRLLMPRKGKPGPATGS